MPKILKATYGFLRQIPDIDDKNLIEIPPSLLQKLDYTATTTKKELEYKYTYWT